RGGCRLEVPQDEAQLPAARGLRWRRRPIPAQLFDGSAAPALLRHLLRGCAPGLGWAGLPAAAGQASWARWLRSWPAMVSTISLSGISPRSGWVRRLAKSAGARPRRNCTFQARRLEKTASAAGTL